MAGNVLDKTSPSDPVSSLNPEQVQNVKTIIATGKSLGINDNGIVTALAVANDESTFLNYGNRNVPGSEQGAQAMGQDHKSVGVFQQQVGTFGWGHDVTQMMDPVHQAAAFFGGTPNASAPGMLQQPGWQTKQPGALAQQIQQSGTPSAYYPLVTFGQKLLATYGGEPPIPLPFTPRAVGPNFVHHSIEALKAAPPPDPQYIPSQEARPAENNQGGLSMNPRAARVNYQTGGAVAHAAAAIKIPPPPRVAPAGPAGPSAVAAPRPTSQGGVKFK